jgi:hypothetical protein
VAGFASRAWFVPYQSNGIEQANGWRLRVPAPEHRAAFFMEIIMKMHKIRSEYDIGYWKALFDFMDFIDNNGTLVMRSGKRESGN